MSQTRGLRIRTQCATLDELVRVFNKFCDETSIFVPTPSPRDEGIEAAFSIDLASGEPALVGQGVVIGSWTSRDNRYGQAGMQIGVRKVTPSSARVYEQMLIAKALAKDTKANVFADEGTDVSMPAFDEQASVPRSIVDLQSAPIEGAPVISAKHTLLGLPIIPHMPAPSAPVMTAAPAATIPAPAASAPMSASPAGSVQPMITVKPKLSPNAFIGVPARITPKAGDAPEPKPAAAVARGSQPALRESAPKPGLRETVMRPAILREPARIVRVPERTTPPVGVPVVAPPVVAAEPALAPKPAAAPAPAAKPITKPGALTKGWDAMPDPIVAAAPKPAAADGVPEPMPKASSLTAGWDAMPDPVVAAPVVAAPIVAPAVAQPAVAAPVVTALVVEPPVVPAVPEPVVPTENKSSRVARAGTVLGSGPVPRLPAGFDGDDAIDAPYEVPGSVDVPDDDDDATPTPISPDFDLTERDVVNHFALASHGLAPAVEVAPIVDAVPILEPSVDGVPAIKPPESTAVEAAALDAAPILEMPRVEAAPVVEEPAALPPVEEVAPVETMGVTKPRRRRRFVGIAIAMVALVCAAGGFAAGFVVQQRGQSAASIEAPTVDVVATESPEAATSEVAREPEVPVVEETLIADSAPTDQAPVPVLAVVPTPAPVAPVAAPAAVAAPTATRGKRPTRSSRYVKPRSNGKTKRACDDLSCL